MSTSVSHTTTDDSRPIPTAECQHIQADAPFTDKNTRTKLNEIPSEVKPELNENHLIEEIHDIFDTAIPKSYITKIKLLNINPETSCD